MLYLPSQSQETPKDRDPVTPLDPPQAAPRSVVVLVRGSQRLYAELIQKGSAQLSWIRPLVLWDPPQAWDLQNGADLLWRGSVEEAFAEEFLPLLAQAQPTPEGPRLLHEFLRLL